MSLMSPITPTVARIDPRTPEGRAELAASHGWPAAWRAAIARIERDIAKCESNWRFDPRHKLQMQLKDAQFQLDHALHADTDNQA